MLSEEAVEWLSAEILGTGYKNTCKGWLGYRSCYRVAGRPEVRSQAGLSPGIISIIKKMLHKEIAAFTKLKGVTTLMLLVIGSAVPILVL